MIIWAWKGVLLSSILITVDGDLFSTFMLVLAECLDKCSLKGTVITPCPVKKKKKIWTRKIIRTIFNSATNAK
jgi:hypothetical protein